MIHANENTVFHLLDGARGIAAIAVVILHLRVIFGGYVPYNAYLAVDLFFVMSGFVIAHAYEKKLVEGSLSTSRFMIVRYIRLWPLFFLSIIVSLFGIYIGGGFSSGAWRADQALWATIMAALMLPAPVTSDLALYPLNGPGWSLFYELVANFAYARLIGRASTRNLIIVAALSFVLMLVAISISRNHQISVGTDVKTIPVALARVGFSFPAGIIAYRLFRATSAPNYGDVFANMLSVSFLALVAVVLIAPLPREWNFVFTPLFLSLSPVLVFWMARLRISLTVQRVFSFFGLTSYGLYVLHAPLGFTILEVVRQTTGRTADTFPAAAGFILLGVLLAIVWALDTWFDRPVRRALTSLARGGIVRRAQA